MEDTERRISIPNRIALGRLDDAAIEKMDCTLGISGDVGVVGHDEDGPSLLLQLDEDIHDLHACF